MTANFEATTLVAIGNLQETMSSEWRTESCDPGFVSGA
jgi:hypothetical protein